MTSIIFNNFLIILCFSPVIGVLGLFFISKNNSLLLKKIALYSSSASFLGSLILWFCFNKSIGSFQMVSSYSGFPLINIHFILGVDGISLFFIILTTFLIFLCLLVSWKSVSFNLKEYLISFLVLEFFLLGVFLIMDLMLFYIFFESILIPMYLIIGIWGSRERKIRAAFFFLFIHY